MPKPPAPPPEARLLKLARLRRNHMSIPDAAALAGVSASLWRQVEAGYSTPAAGIQLPKVTPADTLALMSRPLGITPAQLTEAGRDDAAVILAELLRPEPAAVPELIPEPASDSDSGDDVTGAVVAALFGPKERKIWARIRHHLETTPAGAELFTDPAQATAWPPESPDGFSGGAPFDLTAEARELLNSIPAASLFTAPAEVIVWNLTELPYRKRVGMIREYREPVRPTTAVRRAG